MVWREDLSALRSTVKGNIDEGRLGRASFMRCVVRAEGPDALEAALEDLVSLADDWFGTPHEKRHRQSGDTGLYLTEMLKWSEGQGALLIVTSATSRGAPEMDLMLVGSKGTLYHHA